MVSNTENNQLGPIRRFLRKRLKGWMLRHQLPSNFWIHMIGIPMAVAGVICWLTLSLEQWWVGTVLFVMGYFLQWVGHCWEGNDVGEWAAIKRMFGLPYIGIAPRWNPEDPNQL